MGLIKEPKNVDLSTKSEPWTEQELADFRKIMQQRALIVKKQCMHNQFLTVLIKYKGISKNLFFVDLTFKFFS
jgi:hypothetical protein